MTSFGDVIELRHLNYVIKMTLQKISIFKPPPLAKSWLRPCVVCLSTLLFMLLH